MPLASALVGCVSPAYTYAVDARWLMAYAAGTDSNDAAYFDTTRALACHPLFPVCLEWDAILAVRTGPCSACLSAAEQARAVHAEHDLHRFVPIRPGMTLTAVATIVAIRACPPGALMLKRIDTRDAVNGELVCRTWQSTLYRGVAVAGGDRIAAEAAPALPAWSASAASVIWPLPIPAGAAHVYTECARIWNPIHTDLAQARAAGLDAIILHGTATLARAVTALLARLPDGDPARIARVACRFSGMVSVPDTLTLRMAETADNVLQFEIQDARGRNVISRGRVVCRTPG